jgi:ribonucleoside-diphosphate reductase alpha chain
MNYLGIDIDTDRDALFDELGVKRLRESYMQDNETSPQHRFAFVSKQFGSNDEHAQRLYEYSSKHWLSYSTPILSFGRSKRGMPISCFLNFIEDTAEGLVENLSETNWLSMLGGGVGIGFGIRSADDKSTGVMPHLKMYDASSLAYRQGRTRRGSYAAYLDISHPDITNFLEMRKSTGDQNLRCMNLHHGVNINDKFMQIIENCMIDPEAKDDWELTDPHSGEIREVVSAKHLWQQILELRMHTGEPYLHFIDTSNKHLPQHLKDLGLKVHQSNLCSEIILPTNEKRTAVCCLSSLNLEYFDEWKDNELFLEDVAEMLDNVLQFFIDNAPDSISRAKYSAMRERSIGVGALGFHAYLQKENIAFEGVMAKIVNKQIFKQIRVGLDKANKSLGLSRGEAPDAVGTGQRFSHLMAIAPNASSSIIMGNTSPSIEPYRANAYRQDTLSGSSLTKNKWLDKVIIKYLQHGDPESACDQAAVDEIWSSIIANDGSVQHLTWMSEIDKAVFKTSMEIDQRWVIELAADRQQYIDQGQSLNLFFRPDAHIKYLHAIHFMAWKKGLKTLYYCRSEKIGKADKVSKKIERQVIKELDMTQVAQGNDCIACEG